MRRALIWSAAATLATASWLPAWLTPGVVSAPTLIAGVVGTLAASAWAGREAREGTPAVAGASVAAVAWLLAACPVAALWAASPVVELPAVGDDPEAVMVTALSVALIRGAWAVQPSAVLVLLGGLAGAAAGGRHVRAPGPAGFVLSVLSVLVLPLVAMGVTSAFATVSASVVENQATGLLRAGGPGWPLEVPGLLTHGVALGVAVAGLVMSGRAMGRPGVVRLAAVVAAGNVLAVVVPAPYLFGWVPLLGIGPALAGVAVGARWPLAPAAPLGPVTALEHGALAAVVVTGVGAAQLGWSVARVHIERLPDLTRLGADAPPTPALLAAVRWELAAEGVGAWVAMVVGFGAWSALLAVWRRRAAG